VAADLGKAAKPDFRFIIRDMLRNRTSLIKSLYLNLSVTIKSQIIFILQIDFKKVINYEVWY
jgi:hypothetical protein